MKSQKIPGRSLFNPEDQATIQRMLSALRTILFDAWRNRASIIVIAVPKPIAGVKPVHYFSCVKEAHYQQIKEDAIEHLDYIKEHKLLSDSKNIVENIG